ncbi:hypothetical protein N9Y18_03850 [Litoricolaceae bacterium]|nr:hypothetical protein [Litorivicinaceae bacterium]
MRLLLGIIVSGVSILAYAGSHQQSDTSETILTAIKEQFVAQARAAETQVTNTAWLDSDGRLHESTMIRSDVRVRGVQVRRYLDEMSRPEVEIALDDKSGALPQCFTNDDHLIRTVKVYPAIQQGQFDVNHRGLVYQLGQIVTQEFHQGLERSPYWHTLQLTPPSDGYRGMVSGIRAEVSRYDMQIVLSPDFAPEAHQPERIPGSDPIRTFFDGHPSWLEESWVRLDVSLIDAADRKLIWQGKSLLRIPVRRVSYTDDRIPTELIAPLTNVLSRWVSDLTDFGRCEPIHFAVIRQGDNEFQIDGGSASGIAVGDQLLLIDRDAIPQRTFEPGALAQLSLIKVIQTFENSATIEHVAGAPLEQIGGKVALPF